MIRDDDAELLLLACSLATDAERRLAGRLAPLGLRPAQFRLLFAIRLEAERRLRERTVLRLTAAEAAAVPMADVMRVLGDLPASSLSSALSGLPADTVSVGPRSGRDGRHRSLRLSAGGEALALKAVHEAGLAADDLTSGLDEAERAGLLRLLRRRVGTPDGSGEG